MMETYQADGQGGFFVIKDGARAGSVPSSHPLVAQIEARAAKRQVTVLEAQDESVTPDAPLPTVADLVALLIDKKVLSQKELDDKAASRRG